MSEKCIAKRIVSISMVMILAAGIFFAGKIPVNAAAKTAINITNITMSKGQSRQLKVNKAQQIRWSSSKKSVVTVSKKGKITAKRKGTAVVTAAANGKKYRCKVTVNQPSRKNQDILIVYFSQTGTTKEVAEKLKKLTGGDLLRIQEQNKYPDDYDKTVTRAKKELNQNSYPVVTSVAANMKGYDVVYVGFPIWWHSTPRVVNTFLEEYNLKGKTVIPFCTSGGSDIEEAIPALEKSCEGATLLDGYTAESGTTREIRSWLKRIGQL